MRIALLGNPNTGKSTVFNRLTGLRQHIANYPGITVEKKTGALLLGGHQMEIQDLPGAYSLAAASPDERVVMDALGGRAGQRAPDLIVCVLDATNLKRNLLLVSQAAELEIPMLVVLNQWDAAERNGLRINTGLLADRLGVPVITTVAQRGTGLAELKKAIEHAVSDPRRIPRILWPEFVDEARDVVRDGLSEAGVDVTGPEALRMIFDTDSAFAE